MAVFLGYQLNGKQSNSTVTRTLSLLTHRVRMYLLCCSFQEQMKQHQAILLPWPYVSSFTERTMPTPYHSLPLPAIAAMRQHLSQRQEQSSGATTVLNPMRADWDCQDTSESTNEIPQSPFNETTTQFSSLATEELQPRFWRQC